LYDEGYYRYREQTRDFRTETDILLRLLRLEPGCRVLEVGCGGGALLARLETEGCRPTGIDLLEGAVEAAVKMVDSCEVLCADAVDLPFEDLSFDRLVSHHLVEHLPDLAEALAEWRRVLAPGGVMAICTPNRLYPDPSIFADPGHLHVYDPDELGRAVARAGFDLEETMTVFPWLLKNRVSVKVGVPSYALFRRLPHFSSRGRSILLSASRR
jgi:SAM-dependent methyltransferase